MIIGIYLLIGVVVAIGFALYGDTTAPEFEIPAFRLLVFVVIAVFWLPLILLGHIKAKITKEDAE